MALRVVSDTFDYDQWIAGRTRETARLRLVGDLDAKRLLRGADDLPAARFVQWLSLIHI